MFRVSAFISGFGQAEFKSAGLHGLMINCSLVNPKNSRCFRFSWRHSVLDICNNLIQSIKETLEKEYTKIQICLIGYSYGGTTAVSVAEELNRRGVIVSKLFLIDPVWRRFAWLPSLFSIMGIGSLTIPQNVVKYWHWYQREGVIRSCTVIPENSQTTQQVLQEEIHCSHTQCDEHPKVHETIFKEVTDERS